jgi:dihydrofolate synthase / folylpolyglutamate synthase
MFERLTQAIAWIEHQQRFKPKSDLERMHAAFTLSGTDLSGIKKIHVAGTNGKGSVAAYVTNILSRSGHRVGTYTSPYLLQFNERIRIGMVPIPDHDLLEGINWVSDLNGRLHETYGERLSFFELVTLMAFRHFSMSGLSHVVIEVGLGGLLDATNILDYDVSLITNIGFDHMKQLGNTLESIAYNKLGILKPGSTLITTVDEALRPFFRSELERLGVPGAFLSSDQAKKTEDNPLTFIWKGETWTTGLLGDHQIKNAILAIEAVRMIEPETAPEWIREGLSMTSWKGRLEHVRGPVETVLDSAHNIHAIDALADVAETLFKDRRILTLFSSLGDKDVKAMIDKVRSFSDLVCLTSFPDARYHDISGFAGDHVLFVADAMTAYRTLVSQAKDQDVILVTGSLHFIGHMSKLLPSDRVKTDTSGLS